MKNHVAGHFEQAIPDEEDSGAQAIRRIGQTDVRRHLQLRERDINLVQLIHDQADQNDRNQAPEDLGVGGRTAGRMSLKHDTHDGLSPFRAICQAHFIIN